MLRAAGAIPVSIRNAPASGCSTRKHGIGSHSQRLRGANSPRPRTLDSGPDGRWKKRGGERTSAVRIGVTVTPAPSRPPGNGSVARLG